MLRMEKSQKNKLVLEVIACSVADAIEAEKGGANRLELISHFEVGGLTPPTELVREILAAVRIPVRVMLRENEGYAVSGEAELEKLCAAAREIAGLKVDGLVLGFLSDGAPDFDPMKRILACAPSLKATFHHAFDEASDPIEVINGLKQLGQVDLILTSGGGGDWSQKITLLADYQLNAAPGISILVGGGVNAQVIGLIRRETSIQEFHVGSAARIPPNSNGHVEAGRVRELVRSLELRSDKMD
jgi:copper homeostasis protein